MSRLSNIPKLAPLRQQVLPCSIHSLVRPSPALSRLLAADGVRACLQAASTNSAAGGPRGRGAAGRIRRRIARRRRSGRSRPSPRTARRYPNQELTENLLYEYLLAEIAGQRGNVALSRAGVRRSREAHPRSAHRAARHRSCAYAGMNNARDRSRNDLARGRSGFDARPAGSRGACWSPSAATTRLLPHLRELLAGSAGDPANRIRAAAPARSPTPRTSRPRSG